MFGENENTEEKIIKATFDILENEGLAKTTTKKIAAEAGVNEVTIFRKFGNKNNLIEAAKEHYLKKFNDKIEETFSYEEDESVEEYLNNAFFGMLSFNQDDIKILRVAMGEVRDDPKKKLLISEIIEPLFKKLEGFFKLKIEKGEIRSVNYQALTLICYSMLFQSAVLWQIHHDNPDFEAGFDGEDIKDIIFNGIKLQ